MFKVDQEVMANIKNLELGHRYWVRAEFFREKEKTIVVRIGNLYLELPKDMVKATERGSN